MTRRSSSSCLVVRSLNGGFALLLSITLLAFLVLLLLGLATFTRVETAAVTAGDRQTQAREYALFAHRLALAELQEFAGPDQRVTATAETGSNSLHPHWTGAWDSITTGSQPLTWLVSGNETEPLTVRPDLSLAVADYAELVGVHSSGSANNVVAPLQSVAAAGVPGAPSSSPSIIGRYAWWVGDQGVKAPVAVGGRSDYFQTAPYDSAETRARLRQQVAFGAGPADPAGHSIFEPRDPNNVARTLDDRVIAFGQIAFLGDAANRQLGLAGLREHFHHWSPNNHAVLANPKLGGLRQDLSLRPDLLGAAFAAWSDYNACLEAPIVGATEPTPTILPPYGPDPLRRRHKIGAPISAAGLVFTRAPVLVSFFLQFNVRRVGGNAAPAATTALEVRARMVVQLWNPWTSALVPEPLRLEVTDLPDLTVEDSNGGRQSLSLSGLFGQPMKMELTAEDVAFPGDPDDRSWLPGRVYSWRSKGGDRDGWRTEFYNRTLSVPNASVWVVPTGVSYVPPASNSVRLTVSGPSARLTLVLKEADGTLLSTIQSPLYAAFSTTPQRVSANDEYRFGYPLRVVDPVDFVAATGDEGWLTIPGADPRATVSGEPLFRTGSGGDLPSVYVGVGGNSVLSDENRLLDRVMGKTGMSYNEDTPVFELLRSLPLSLGQLQHLQVLGERPFSIGNSWGATATVNGVPVREFFDRFFFSGLQAGVTPPVSVGRPSSPNPLLQILSRHGATGNSIAFADLNAAADGRSSKFLLQGGAFNVNSVDVGAWIAVLRSSRITPPPAFTYLDASTTTGTAGDNALGSLQSARAAFYRFSQSAQETYKADAGYAASTALPPAEPEVPSLANTHLFRRGVRALAPTEVAALAHATVNAIRAHHARAGPFRSLEEFLGPDPLFNGRSVLEKAIDEAAINSSIAEFSSQWLTQADILTTLAPVLFPRSDTFMIRSYGEAANPATGATEGRAWCEAIVQRTPEYLDATADDATTLPPALINPLNQTHGRRFKVVSFRWLTRSDI